MSIEKPNPIPNEQAYGPGAAMRLERTDPEETVVVLTGQLKFDTIDDMMGQILQDMARIQPRRLVLDCAHVDFVDSQALTLLLGLSRSCRKAGGELLLRNPKPMVRTLLKMTKLDTLFTILETAIAADAATPLSAAPRVPLKPFGDPSL